MAKTATQELMVPNETITNRIFTVRGIQVMIDRDLAELYEVETKQLNRAVKRNADRFPESFMFQLTQDEWENLRYQIGTSSSRQLALDLEKHNAQYEPVVIHLFGAVHDRFLIIDERTLYHIGASLKDLGKKWFAFSKMDSEALTLLQRLNEVA